MSIKSLNGADALTLQQMSEPPPESIRMSKDQMEAMLTVREVLGVQAQCSYAAKNATYHNWLIELDDLDGFWERMDADSYKDQVVACLGDKLMLHQYGAIPMLILSMPDWDRLGGHPVRDSAFFCTSSWCTSTTSRVVSYRRDAIDARPSRR